MPGAVAAVAGSFETQTNRFGACFVCEEKRQKIIFPSCQGGGCQLFFFFFSCTTRRRRRRRELGGGASRERQGAGESGVFSLQRHFIGVNIWVGNKKLFTIIYQSYFLSKSFTYARTSFGVSVAPSQTWKLGPRATKKEERKKKTGVRQKARRLTDGPAEEQLFFTNHYFASAS